MIYFDNAATTFPKPATVVNAVAQSLVSDGNPGRGAHAPAMHAAAEIYAARKAAAELFGAKAERVIFTS
ncbi:MAG: aminotransferase class V-fold PLP-dependent enzyme, partial [Clostridia bacterium]|nr:aminotransferase class V-fold PLP-dependent enzyme [Clostridia bacterium]